jgi:hypothetical protein
MRVVFLSTSSRRYDILFGDGFSNLHVWLLDFYDAFFCDPFDNHFAQIKYKGLSGSGAVAIACLEATCPASYANCEQLDKR